MREGMNHHEYNVFHTWEDKDLPLMALSGGTVRKLRKIIAF